MPILGITASPACAHAPSISNSPHGIRAMRCLNPLAAAILFKTRRGPVAMFDKSVPRTDRGAAKVVPTIHALQGIRGFSHDDIGASRAADARLAGHCRVP